MKNLARVMMLLVLAAVCQGCTSEGRCKFGLPNFFHPGPAPVQEARAVRFDPYPQDQAGPDIVGGRPRDYQQSVSEDDRARWQDPATRERWFPCQ
jgi:hypothetical protein